MTMPAEKPNLYPINNKALINGIQENYSTGFISLFRSIREHWIWDDPRKFQWWVDILMECNHADRKFQIGFDLIECKRGQTLHSLLEWSKRWRVDISTVRRFLKLLQSDNMIVLEPLSKTTRITVCKYDSYQQKGHDKDTVKTRQGHAGQTQDNTNNNVDNVDNENKEYRHNIKLTEKQHAKLVAEIGEEQTNICYDYLSDYKIEKNYSTKSDYATITRWVIKAVNNGAGKNKQPQDKKMVF